jgi:hypothetical protein
MNSLKENVSKSVSESISDSVRNHVWSYIYFPVRYSVIIRISYGIDDYVELQYSKVNKASVLKSLK